MIKLIRGVQRAEIRCWQVGILTLSLVLLVACGGAGAPVSGGETASQPHDDVERRIAVIAPVGAHRWPLLNELPGACPPPASEGDDARLDWAERCALPSTAGFDPASGRWLILDVDRSEGGIEGFVLSSAAVDGESVLLRESLSPESVARLVQATRAHSSAPTDVITGRADAEFSLSTYSPLVSLGGALEGGYLYLETTTDLDHPEYVLWLFRSRHAPPTALARRTAERTPCDGDGWTCAASEGDCTPAQLRAENRLCVQPLGIDHVAVEAGTLLVMGTKIVAGDGGYPAFHWVAPLPAH